MASLLKNVSAVGASRQLVFTGMGLQQAIQRLTTPYPLDEVSDEAAGLGICWKLSIDIRIAGQGRRNATDALCYLGKAVSTLEVVAKLLTYAAKLDEEVQATALSEAARKNGDAEFQGILSTIADLNLNTKFNGVRIFEPNDVVVAVGEHVDFRFRVGTLSGPSGSAREVLTFTRGSDKLDTLANAQAVESKIAKALEVVEGMRVRLGAFQKQLKDVSDTLGVQAENCLAAYNQLRESNYSDEVVNFTKFQMLNQFGVSVGQAVPKMRSPASPRPGRI